MTVELIVSAAVVVSLLYLAAAPRCAKCKKRLYFWQKKKQEAYVHDWPHVCDRVSAPQ
ncbi:MAG TPA: hypothetical protein VHC20_07265 [Candidatus Paceibacterota bacterium]|nr:hypothetical protein [Candidatus Paceibacterota bacterium]